MTENGHVRFGGGPLEKYHVANRDQQMPAVGDWVRLRQIPSWVRELGNPDVQHIYSYALGKVFQVESIDHAGKLELWIYPPDNPFGEQVDVLHVDPI